MIKNFIKKFLPQSYLKKRNRLLLDKFYSNWSEQGKLLPIPHEVKRRALLLSREKFDLDVLIETGTFQGHMVLFQQPYFKKIISIELGNELFENAKIKFEAHSNVTILHGDSAIVLPSIIHELEEPALFFLDGHYSAGETSRADLNTPIQQELESILSSKFNHVVVIDDAKDFNGTNDYPSIASLERIVKSRRPDYEFAVEDGLIFINKKNR